MRIINPEKWVRKEHFNFFSKFDEPFFGVVSEIDCTSAYNNTKRNGISFFAWYLHCSLKAVNRTEEFMTRIDGSNVVIYDVIHGSATIGREDGTFGFSFLPFSDDFFKFNEALKEEIKQVRSTPGLRLTVEAGRQDLIHLSSLPWYKVTGVSHPRNFDNSDSVPKITFGKFYESGDKKVMNISVCMHHGLADGRHVADFLELFQESLNRDI